MAASPAYSSTVNIGSAVVSATLDTSLTAPTHAVTVFTAGASGSQSYEVKYQALGTTVAGVINVFRVNGGTYYLIEQILVGAVTSSTTAVAWSTVRQYANDNFKSGDTLAFTVTIAGLQSLIAATVKGADY